MSYRIIYLIYKMFELCNTVKRSLTTQYPNIMTKQYENNVQQVLILIQCITKDIFSSSQFVKWGVKCM